MYQTIRDSKNLLEVPSQVPGVSMKLLEDRGGGGLNVSTRMADETVFVRKGDFVQDGVSYALGEFFAGAARTQQGRIRHPPVVCF